MSVNMTDNNLDEDLCQRMEAQEQTSRTQQEALENIQHLVNQNINDTGSNHNEYNNDKHPKTEKSKEISSIDAEVIKDIQAQIASLTQRDELKKVGMMRPYLLEWD